MKKSIRLLAALLCVVFISGTLGGCAGARETASGPSGAQESGEPENSGSPETPSSSSRTEPEDTASSLTEGASVIVFSGDGAALSGGGAEVSEGVVTITEGGVYVLSGETKEGRVIVNAPDGEVTLVLDSVSVACSYGSPVYVYKSDRTTIFLPEGSSSTLADGGAYTYADSLSSAAEEEPNACLYSKSDLVISGGGSLTVCANYNNGVTGKDTLRIEDCTLSVTAQNHGINGKDSCEVENAAITVSCGGDALRSTNDTDAAMGYIGITDSTLDLTAGEDGIQAETVLTVTGGVCTVVSGGGSAASGVSAKGLKSGSGLTLNGGVYTLDCCDDAVHTNGDLLVSGGTFAVKSGDDGFHADGTVSVTGGEIRIDRSYEGIEGSGVDISGGTLRIVSDDDGINAAGGADQSGVGPWMDAFTPSPDCRILISGGVVTVNASGDGIDSNGSITVSGGELYVSGPENSGNSAIDCGGAAVVTGGIVAAAGAGGMAQNFGGDSTQGSILLNLSGFTTGPVALKDASGNTLVSFSPEKSYNCVVLSCPEIADGETYTVEAGGQNYTVTMDGLFYGSGGFGGGMMGGKDGSRGGMGGVQPGGLPEDGQHGTPPDGTAPEMPGNNRQNPPQRP